MGVDPGPEPARPPVPGLAADRRPPRGLGRVCARAQREASPPARGPRGPSGRRGPGARSAAGRSATAIIVVVVAGAIVGIVFAVSSGNNKPVGSQSSTSTTLTPAAKANAKLQAEANEAAVKAGCPASPTTPANHQTYTAAPAMTIDTTKSYSATVVTTTGTFDIALNAKAAPQDGEQLRLPGRQGLLPLQLLLPGHPRLHQPDRQPRRRPTPGPERRVLHAAGREPATRPAPPASPAYPLGSVAMATSVDGRQRQPVLHRGRGRRARACPARTRCSVWSLRV